MQDAKQQAEQTADRARSKWAQMTTDAAARRVDIKAKIEKRADQLDAKAAVADADWCRAGCSRCPRLRRRRKGQIAGM